MDLLEFSEYLFSAVRWNLARMPAGAVIAAAALCCAVALGWLAALRRLVLRLRSSPARTRVRKQNVARWNPKYLLLLLVALLPGGLVGTAAVALIMGKGSWRRDATLIVGLSLIPGWLLAWTCAQDFPFPALGENFIARATLGIAFAVLQLWVLIKLLRESVGEPVEKVPWWPPLALWLELLLLAQLLMLFLLARE